MINIFLLIVDNTEIGHYRIKILKSLFQNSNKHILVNTLNNEISLKKCKCSDSFTILGVWVLGLATSNIKESPLQTNESKTLFLMTSLPYYCIPGLAEIKTYAQKMQDAQVTKSLYMQCQLFKYWYV